MRKKSILLLLVLTFILAGLFFIFSYSSQNSKEKEASTKIKVVTTIFLIYDFGYLAKRYRLKYIAAQRVSPDSEPTANDLVNLVNQIKENNIKYIFYEEFESPRIAETLSQETQVKFLPLSSAHNISKVDLEKGTSLVTIFINNLANLKIGLQCI